MTSVSIRLADATDLDRLAAIDSVARRDAGRKEEIRRWLAQDTVIVAEVEGRVAGYAALNDGFFRKRQVEILMVDEPRRGRGVGTALLREAETRAGAEKLFVTTNRSNAQMQRLLLGSGYRICGYIDELDPGDPELVFFKRIV